MNKVTARKVAFIGGGGVRTPLVVFGINEAAAQIGARELALFDPDRERVEMIAALGRAVVRREGGSLQVRVSDTLEEAVSGADFVLNSVRVGGVPARAHDERVSIQHGYPGQETTGPGGAAMALRTVPIAIEQATQVHRLAPEAWLINFTNPAGLITQAITQHTAARVVGICDTPTEMLHRIGVGILFGGDGDLDAIAGGEDHALGDTGHSGQSASGLSQFLPRNGDALAEIDRRRSVVDSDEGQGHGAPNL